MPTGYQQVEYIENLGRGRITTTVPLTSTYYVNVKFALTTTNTGALFGNASTDSIGSFFVSRKLVLLKSNYRAVLPTMQLNTLYDLVFYYDSAGSAYRAFLDGVEVSYESDSGNTANNAFCLFYSNWGTYGLGRIYKATIKDSYGGNTTLDMTPCYRKSDNEPGFYDSVSNTFFANSYDTGFPKLAAGPEI